MTEATSMASIGETSHTTPILLYFYSSAMRDSVDLRDILAHYVDDARPRVTLAAVDVDIEANRPLLQAYAVGGLPAAVLVKPDGGVLVVLDDIDPVSIYDVVDAEGEKFRLGYEKERGLAYAKIDEMLSRHKVLVFMKGTEKNPECGFSEKLIHALRSQGVRFEVCNVLSGTDNIRNWVKEYSNFATIPQVFINGKIVGGLESINQLIKDGKLLELVPEDYRGEPALDQAKKTTDDNRLVLYITSDANEKDQIAQKCSVTEKALQLDGLQFATIDTKDNNSLPSELTDDSDINNRLPALYLEGKSVIRGTELVSSATSVDTLKTVLDSSLFRDVPEVLLPKLLNMKPIMVFIKGTPQEPKCGFTRKLLAELDNLNLEFGFFNILQDYYIRETLKTYSNWKTYPQIYLKGKLLGGLDIVKELAEDGELQEMTKNYVRK